MRVSAKFKSLSEWIRSLREISERYPILVEGKRDVLALRRLGIKNVMSVSGKRLADIPDLLEGRWEGVVLLFDLDPHGERLREKTSKLLESQGFLVVEDFREYLREAGIIHIEELGTHG